MCSIRCGVLLATERDMLVCLSVSVDHERELCYNG